MLFAYLSDVFNNYQ